MTGFIILLSLILFGIIIVQIGRISDMTREFRGSEIQRWKSSKSTGIQLVVFVVLFLVLFIWSIMYYKNYMLGFGPHKSASEHGVAIDSALYWTIFFTGIVFFATQIALFYFAYKYREKKGSKASFMAHDSKLEAIWTGIPAIVLVILVVKGLYAWDAATKNVGPDEDVLEIEATGMQFNWMLRYPGADGKLGAKNFRKITGINPLGQDWSDERNLDDQHVSEIVLPVNQKVKVRITSRDVLHSFDMPHFRLKMDAVPGMPTYFVFTPTITTAEYRNMLKDYPEYQVPEDPTDPESPMRWEAFDYELACAELCGNGHFSMRRVVKIVEQEEYEAWLKEQGSYFMGSIRGTEEDLYKDMLFDSEIQERKVAFKQSFADALAAEDKAARRLILDHINFETGSAKLTGLSRYELDNLAEMLKESQDLKIELGGHTDNVGDPLMNLNLSQDRAQAVKDYLVGKGITENRISSKGYGETRPVDTNDTEEGRAKNRRTEVSFN